jgi:3-oxoacyl-[acyl-carrier protein] reductase
MGLKAIVTGGSRGIGRAIVEKLAGQGHTIAFSYKSGAAAAQEVVARCAAIGGCAAAFPMDIADYAQAGKFVDEAKKFLTDVDVLINNAGITRDRSLFIMPAEEWRTVIDTNLTGYFNVTRHLIGYFMKNKRGCIVNVTSVSGWVGVAGQSNYCASKAGIIGFTKALSKETARLGIPVNCIAPGYIQTDMTARLNEKHLAAVTSMIPMQRLGKAEEVAELAAFLVSGKAGYITGHVFTIDGGLTA